MLDGIRGTHIRYCSYLPFALNGIMEFELHQETLARSLLEHTRPPPSARPSEVSLSGRI